MQGIASAAGVSVISGEGEKQLFFPSPDFMTETPAALAMQGMQTHAQCRCVLF